MDVRCERCKTEYEFDESRVTEAGVAVQCTTCGHVFKVKRKEVLVTLPLDPSDMEPGPPTPDVRSSIDTNGAREWRVRQPSGNQLRCRELTTLQRWIVERKVARDDEISLNGQRWKRLGNIAELASFFQVVEEAQRGGRRMDGTPSVVIEPNARRMDGTPSVVVDSDPPSTVEAASPAAYPSLATPSSAGSRSMGFRESSPASKTAKVIVEDIEFPHLNDFPDGLGNTLGRPAGDRPGFQRSDPALEVDIEESQGNADDLPAIKRGGVGRWLFILAVLAGLGALAYFGYVNIWLEQQQKEAAAARADAELERVARARDDSAAQERQRLIAEARARAAAETSAGEEQARVAAEADHPRPAATATPAAQAKPDPPPKPAKVPQDKPRNFDGYMNQAIKLREKQQRQAALDAYAQAAELRPDRAEPFAGRGLTLLDMGESDQAEASFQVALKLNPRYGAAVIGLARTYLAQGKKEKAIEFYEKYLEILPDGPEATAARQKLRQLKEE